MEKTYNLDLIQQIRAYMEQNHLSQNQLAAKVGLSSAALSGYLNQNYKGSIENTERQLAEFLRIADEQAAAADQAGEYSPCSSYVPTSISEDVYQSIRYAQVGHCMVVLHGDAGVGKSKGAQKFVEDHPGTAVLVKVEPCTCTLAGVIQTIATKLQVAGRNRMEQIMGIHAKLDGTNCVLIIDEAQLLNYAALEQIRALNDDNPNTGKRGVGIALIGNSDVYDRMHGRQQARFAQLFNRIQLPREYRCSKVTMADVEKLFPALASRGMRKELEFLLAVSHSEHGVRGAVKLYENAVSSRDVSYATLYKMAAHMRVDRLG